MGNLKIQKTEIGTTDGKKISLLYNESDDVLDIFFGENETATGVELTEDILLRLNSTSGRVVSLTLLHFSILTEQTEYGPRSYPLDKLEEIPDNLRELVVRILTTMPVNQFLKLSHFQESPTKQDPLTYVEICH